MQVPEVVLNSGHKMPFIGFGTASRPLPSSDELTSIFVNAIECGYRHFDTGSVYGTEEPLGRAVAEALRRGLIDSRDQLFITSKLWCPDAYPDLVVPAINKTLENLGLEYLDLYLLHMPFSSKREVQGLAFSGEDILPLDMKGTWQAMEECSRLGLAKSVGVSNFSSHKLSKLLQHATIPPAVNQVELNPAWQQQKLRKFCDEKGIHVCAWSPLGANGASWGTMAVMDSPILKDIATAKGKTVAQVAIRWIYEQGVSPIVKSFNKERMKQNLQVFDWELTEEELGRIQEIPQRRGWAGQNVFSPQGPFKSAEDLWDGDDA